MTIPLTILSVFGCCFIFRGGIDCDMRKEIYMLLCYAHEKYEIDVKNVWLDAVIDEGEIMCYK